MPMTHANGGNLLVMQSGGSTPVMNRSLYGVVRQAHEHGDVVHEIYGAVHGLDGVLDGRLKDLRAPGKGTWERIARTPGAVLGSSRRKLRPDDTSRVLDIPGGARRPLPVHHRGKRLRGDRARNRLGGPSCWNAADRHQRPQDDRQRPRADRPLAPGTAAPRGSWLWRPWARAGTPRRWAGSRPSPS